MQSTTSRKTEEGRNDSGIPGHGSEGITTTVGNTVLEQEDMKVCARMDVPCSRRRGYMCGHSVPCAFKQEAEVLKARTATKLIDADLAEEARGIRARAEKIRNTPFADAERFDAAQFCRDVIAS